jgi:hypothetical protein
MAEQIPIATVCSIRECGFDEYWLQDQVADNPGCLQLGDLELVSRERQQAGGGRLDILLKNPDDDSMYEVEVMLGETNESHIIRTIEYWDREKRRWPQRQHFGVLVAETVTRRFFNVIQLLSHSIPLVAVQANIVEADGKKVLHFSKVLDTYQEPGDETGLISEKHDEAYWQTYSSWTLDAARTLLEAVRPVYPTADLNLVKYHIGIEVNGNNYMWLNRRSAGKSVLGFRLPDTLVSDATKLLDSARLSYINKNQRLFLTIDKQTIEANSALFQELAKLAKQYWEH